VIRRLDRVIPEAPDRPDIAGADHPMRKVTQQIAFEPGGWTPGRAAKVAELFDGLAPEWNQRRGIARQEPLLDALDRGGPWEGLAVEVGSGTGLMTDTIAKHFDSVLSVDLAMEMLRLASPRHLRVRADGVMLPVPDSCAGAVVLVNAFLFPSEVSRITRTVLWVNTVGDRTPIHLSAEDVGRALGDVWEGVASDAGWGTWAVFRRTD
jgi:hypothetical protein